MKHLVAILALLPSAGLTETGSAGPGPDCYCTGRNGERIDLGQVICLQVDGRMYTAQCQMSLNVPMWRELHDGCVSASTEWDQTLMSFRAGLGNQEWSICS